MNRWNVLWITADTFRRDHLGAYGNSWIRTPSLDRLASRSVRFDNHHIASFPTMPARSDHVTGRYALSFMDWEPLHPDTSTLAESVRSTGIFTAAVVDTPFYIRGGMNYDRGFDSFYFIQGQWNGPQFLRHEHWDIKSAWRGEADRFVARTMGAASDWLERHVKDQFFLCVDTWDPHEPWDAPDYLTRLYLPDFDGEVVHPVYGNWHLVAGFTESQLRKAHAAYCGEVTLVDTWIGRVLATLDNTGLSERTVVIFTSDHGFYFGEHGGLFGKMSYPTEPDGTLIPHVDPRRQQVGARGEAVYSWDFSPLYRELTTIPLLISVPGGRRGSYGGLTSAVDMMPTVLDVLDLDLPPWVDGRSLVPAIEDENAPSPHEAIVSSNPIANAGESARVVDDTNRSLGVAPVSTLTTDRWTFLYSDLPGRSELYDYRLDPQQLHNVVNEQPETARELHQRFIEFLRRTGVDERLIAPRSELRL